MQSLLLIATAIAAVQTGDPEQAVTKDLRACRAIAAAEARLACFDRAASVIDEAVASNRIRIVDPEKQKKQQSARFGLVQSQTDESRRLNHLEGRLASSMTRADGRLVLVLADGSSWRQVDDYPLRHTPHAGDPVVIDLTSLGSYRLRVGREAPIRVRRADRS